MASKLSSVQTMKTRLDKSLTVHGHLTPSVVGEGNRTFGELQAFVDDMRLLKRHGRMRWYSSHRGYHVFLCPQCRLEHKGAIFYKRATFLEHLLEHRIRKALA